MELEGCSQSSCCPFSDLMCEIAGMLWECMQQLQLLWVLKCSEVQINRANIYTTISSVCSTTIILTRSISEGPRFYHRYPIPIYKTCTQSGPYLT